MSVVPLICSSVAISRYMYLHVFKTPVSIFYEVGLGSLRPNTYSAIFVLLFTARSSISQVRRPCSGGNPHPEIAT